eukprot:GHVS01016396.1.p1 GENE.GHVS01016396.1~~GHVS01016396.1.p1  ORF type:complete len:199 (+),score=43.39 GHVS01016396.1:175-771(+)
MKSLLLASGLVCLFVSSAHAQSVLRSRSERNNRNLQIIPGLASPFAGSLLPSAHQQDGQAPVQLPFGLPGIPMIPFMPTLPTANGVIAGALPQFGDFQADIAQLLAMPNGLTQLASVFQGMASAFTGGVGAAGRDGMASNPLAVFFPPPQSLQAAVGDEVKANSAARQIMGGITNALSLANVANGPLSMLTGGGGATR